jgi:hypothetical protein
VNTILAVRENAQAEIDEARAAIADHEQKAAALRAKVAILENLLRDVGPAPLPVAAPAAAKPGLRIAR